ncbi:DUF2378 family protein [Archangium gephyra]|uniref:DUF2378 family protein n=1 Tax=Archangium gephyra TaxID=48 RepID=UPI003B7713C0
MPTPREPLVYDATVEAMFSRALKGRLSPRLKARVKEAGIELDAKLKPAYPREVWLRTMRLVVADLYPGVPEERAWFELGERMVDSFSETMMGPAIVGVLKLLGPKRALGPQRPATSSLRRYSDASTIASAVQPLLAPRPFLSQSPSVWMPSRWPRRVSTPAPELPDEGVQVRVVDEPIT